MRKPDSFSKRPKVAGIVTEYNPFHNGHAWMVQRLRELGFDTVVCVMSGPFVQRAEPALLPTSLRAKAALAGGLNLVVRLPAPWATASAEGFGAAGAGLLAALGCVDVLAFGAEDPDTLMLDAVAAVLMDPAFSTELRGFLLEGHSFAVARARAAEKLLPGAGDILARPNNILAVEYCKALRGGAWRGGGNPNGAPSQRAWREAAALEEPEETEEMPEGGNNWPDPLHIPRIPQPLALGRVGAGHDGPPTAEFASAMWLRSLVAERGVEALAPYVPETTLELCRRAWQDGDGIDSERWSLVLMGRLRGMRAGDIARHPGAGEGLEARLAKAARQAVGLEELYGLAKTKRFAHSRVRRLALSAALDFPAGLPPLPPFLHLLAADEKGLALLKTAKRTAALPFSPSLAKLGRTGAAAARAARMEADAEDLYALCEKQPKPGGGVYRQSLIKG